MTGREIVYCARKRRLRIARIADSLQRAETALDRDDLDAALAAAGDAYDCTRNEVQARDEALHDPDAWLRDNLGDAP